MINRLFVSAALVGGISFVSGLQAATIASWSLGGQPGNQASTPAATAAPGVTGLALTRGAGLTASAAGDSFSASGWTAQATDFFSLGFNVAPGSSVNLDRLYLGTRSSATGPGTLGLFYSGDGFSNALTTFNQAPGANFVNSVVDLDALPDLTGNVEFRLIAIGAIAANGAATGSGGTFRVTGYFVGGNFDRDLQFTGTVASTVIPLPAAGWVLLSGLGVLGATARRRRPAQ